MSTLTRTEMLRTFEQQMADQARGELLRQLREKRRLSQEDAAHEIGVTSKSLRTWEKGGPIKWDNAKAVGLFYGVDAEELVTRELVEPAVSTGPVLGYKAEDVVRAERMEAKLDAILKALKITEWLDPDDALPGSTAALKAAEATAASAARKSPQKRSKQRKS